VGGAPSLSPLSCFADESRSVDFRDVPVCGGWFLGALMGGGFSSCADGWVVSRRAGGGEPSLSRGGGPSVWAAEF
jgi:hypothetical protein